MFVLYKLQIYIYLLTYYLLTCPFAFFMSISCVKCVLNRIVVAYHYDVCVCVTVCVSLIV